MSSRRGEDANWSGLQRQEFSERRGSAGTPRITWKLDPGNPCPRIIWAFSIIPTKTIARRGPSSGHYRFDSRPGPLRCHRRFQGINSGKLQLYLGRLLLISKPDCGSRLDNALFSNQVPEQPPSKTFSTNRLPLSSFFHLHTHDVLLRHIKGHSQIPGYGQLQQSLQHTSTRFG